MLYDPLPAQEKPKLHEWNTLPPRTKAAECNPKIDKYIKRTQIKKGPAPITWTVSDLAKAGCLLSSPPITSNFEDEQEMRRVYTLIYDVFRYKNVLSQALDDVRFFLTFPKLAESVPTVWLLLYDLYHRSFNKRETNIAQLAHQLFDAYGLSFAENALWTQKIKLAAAVARLRIKNSALSLSELLPPHLKDEKITEQAQNNPVTCWINIFKARDKKSLCTDIEKTFSLKMVSDITKVNRNNFKWDRHCPHIIVFHASMRTRLAKSDFVKNHLLIVQDKSFCLGPATFRKLLNDLELTGSVIQTHVNSPRTTAYLAALLSQNEKIKKVIAFSAGKRKEEYESYFNQLGMSNIKLFSDRLIDTPPDASYMEEVVAVFATPPNSYSAVEDPIDLVCSRGGDLSMLEILTESGDTKEARERVACVLEEQQKTLRFAMSRPQIQFVLYETHSELEAENKCMVEKALREINRIAKIQHATLQGHAKTVLPPPNDEKEISEINNNENITNKCVAKMIVDNEESKNPDIIPDGLLLEGSENILEMIVIPNTDIFDNCQLPMLCPSESCKGFQKEICGCYLALLQRKEIIRLDDKYMIKMAEDRGLFGSNNTQISKAKSIRTMRRKIEKPEKHEVAKKKLKESETYVMCRNNVLPDKVATEPKLATGDDAINDDDVHNSFSTENVFKKDVYVMHKPMMSRNLLSKMNSAHIRQFVSPFYRQFDLLPQISSPILETRIPIEYVKASTRFLSIMKKARSDRPITKVTNKVKKIEYQTARQQSGERRERLRKIGCAKSVDGMKNKRIEQIVARVCIPTQSVLMKMTYDQEAEDQHSKKCRPNALECSKRIFHCDLCRKRNSDY